MSSQATFTFTSDPERLAVALGEIRRASGLSVVSQSAANGRTSLVIMAPDPWPPSRLDAAGNVLSFFFDDLDRS